MAIPRNLANLANQLNTDGEVPKIEVGDTSVAVTDTGSNGKITGTADNTAVFSVEKGKTFVLQGGVSSTGVGIAFPADQTTVGASTDANTLDDYEEGTWTPSDGSGAGLTFAQNQGRYTKIGREVTCYMAVEYPSTANGNNAQINGLPFTSANNASQQAFGGSVIFTTLDANYAFFIPGNGTTTYSHTYAGARQANSVFSSKIVYVVLQYQTA